MGRWLPRMRAGSRGGVAILTMAGYKTPRRLVLVAEIPRTASGKILKHQLRASLEG